MSKIICDVCGTSYPETAAQCPICGCVRSGDPITVAGDTNDVDMHSSSSYTYVKGGRFSKSNVKKRNSGKLVYTAEPDGMPEREGSSEKRGEKALIITIVALLFAIVAIVIYIACSFFDIKLPSGDTGATQGNSGTTGQSQQSTTEPTKDSTVRVPCESLKVSDTVIEFNKKDAVLLLNVTALPKGQTDEIKFVSDNTAVATVDVNGKVVAVGNGQATITITCGEQTATCRVVCTIAEATTPPTVPDVTYPIEEFKLNREDFTLKTSNPVWVLYRGEIPVDLIEWRSDDETVATFEEGVVTAIGPGVTKVYATYQGVTLSCIVRVY